MALRQLFGEIDEPTVARRRFAERTARPHGCTPSGVDRGWMDRVRPDLVTRTKLVQLRLGTDLSPWRRHTRERRVCEHPGAHTLGLKGGPRSWLDGDRPAFVYQPRLRKLVRPSWNLPRSRCWPYCRPPFAPSARVRWPARRSPGNCDPAA